MKIVKCAYCGKEFQVYPYRTLKQGNLFCSHKCSCLFKCNNVYIKTPSYYILELTSKKYGKVETFIDLDDYEKIKDYQWFVQDNYITTNIVKSNGKRGTLRLHRLILDYYGSKHVDHINHNTYDNRKINLNIVENYQNQQNAIRKSKHCGVYKQKNGKYVARIKANGKDIYLGIFKNLEDALLARKNAEIKYWEYKQQILQKISECEEG